jgi:hypothetical protein
VIPTEQSIIYQDSAQLITIFMPFDDIVTVSCTNMSTVNRKYNLTVRLKNVRLPKTCKAMMTELVLFASAMTSFERVIDSGTSLDITVDLLKLADSLEVIHGLNITQLDQDFARYANLTSKTEFDF